MYNLPGRSYLIHKAVEFANTSVSVRKQYGTAQAMADSGEYIGQPKLDGCNGILVVQDGAYLFTRTGEPVTSCDHIIQAASKLPDGVYLGELWVSGTDQPTISGMVRTKKEQCPLLSLFVFDLLAVDAFNEGMMLMSFEDRYEVLCGRQAGPSILAPSAGLGIGGIYIVPCYGLEGTDVKLKADGCFEHFHDGVIMRLKRGGWMAGPGKDGYIIKVKPNMTADLECVGTYEGKGKYEGKIGGLYFRWKDGKTIPAGSGLSDAERDLPASHFIGKIYELQALSLTPDGMLREPRIKGQRTDKEHPDY